jgi:hypothetical protein
MKTPVICDRTEEDAASRLEAVRKMYGLEELKVNCAKS